MAIENDPSLRLTFNQPAVVELHAAVERGGELLVEADVTLALVDRERMKPARMPPELEQALTP